MGPGTQALLGGHEPGRKKCTEGRRHKGVSNPKVKEPSRSHGKEPEVLPRTRLSTKVSRETTRRVLLCHSFTLAMCGCVRFVASLLFR